MCHVVWQVEEKIKQTHRKYLLQEQLKIIKKVTEAVFTLPQFWRCRPSPSPQAIEMKGEWSLSPFYFSVIKKKKKQQQQTIDVIRTKIPVYRLEFTRVRVNDFGVVVLPRDPTQNLPLRCNRGSGPLLRSYLVLLTQNPYLGGGREATVEQAKIQMSGRASNELHRRRGSVK